MAHLLQEPSAWMQSFTGAFTMTSTACMATPWQEPQTRKRLVPPLTPDWGRWEVDGFLVFHEYIFEIYFVVIGT